MPRSTVSGSPACTRVASLSGVPSSRATVRAISSARAVSAVCSRSRCAARSAGSVAAQPGNAARAAATARSTSAAVPAGTCPIELAGGRVLHGDQSPDGGSTHSPPRCRWRRRRRHRAARRRGGEIHVVPSRGRARKLALGVSDATPSAPADSSGGERSDGAGVLGGQAVQQGVQAEREGALVDAAAGARRAGAPGAGAGSARRTAPGPRRNRGRTSRAPTRPRSSASPRRCGWPARAASRRRTSPP